MFDSLSKLFSFSAGKVSRKPVPTVRRARLGLESLEDRALPSVSMLSPSFASTATTSLVQHVTTSSPSNVNVPNLAGVTFSLNVNGQAYQFAVNSESYNADGSANLSCTLKVPGGQSYQARYAYLSYTNGGLHFDAEFDTSGSSAIEVGGWISRVQNTSNPTGAAVNAYHYDFVGAVSFFQNGQLQNQFINVSGEGNPPPLVFAQ